MVVRKSWRLVDIWDVTGDEEDGRKGLGAVTEGCSASEGE